MDVTNVTTGKPNPAGAMWWAPLGTTLPTDATTALDNAFLPLGYVSSDGLTNADNITTETIRAWGGDVVDNPQTEHTDTMKAKFIEILNLNVLKMVYGPDNVSGTLATGITLRSNNNERPAGVFVCDMALRDGAKKRIVAPNAKLSNLADISYKDNDAVGYDATLACRSGGFGGNDPDTHKEYIKRAAATTTTP